MSRRLRLRLRRATDGPSAVELLEEAIHLLRVTPVSAFAIYALGAVTWLGAFLHFWAHLAWFAPSAESRALSALGVVLAWMLLKVAQSEFAARLYAQRTGAEPPRLSWRRTFALAGAQLRVQCWSLALLPLAALSLVALPWAFAFFQSASVLGATPEEPRRLRREAWKLAGLWPVEHLRLAVCVVGFGAAVVANLLTTTYALPWIANRILGIENIFAIDGLALMNTTFLSIVGGLAWLALDPLLKALYVLRVFYGRAQHTGEDLRELFFRGVTAPPAGPGASPSTAASPLRAGRGLAAALLLGAMWFAAVRPASAAGSDSPAPRENESGPAAAPARDGIDLEAPSPTPAPSAPPPAAPLPTPPRVAPAELDRALDATLRESDFQWSLRPLPGVAVPSEEGPIMRFFAAIREWLGDLLDSIWRAIGRFIARLLEFIFGRRAPPQFAPAGERVPTSGLGEGMLYVLLALVVLALGWVLWTTYRNRRKTPATVEATATTTTAAPDLRDESLTAAQLPAEGWLELARQQIAAGQWRLAWRALYLATLARHADDGLLALARHKTNLDYERELARRALTRTELVAAFRARRRGFEDVWYGNLPALEAPARSWLQELEAQAAALPPAGAPAAGGTAA